MTDQTVNKTMPGRAPRMEFRVYFALILMLALPVTMLKWVAALVRTGQAPAQGPLAQAFCEARTITPLIFSN